MRRYLFLAAGFLIILAGILIAPLPGPGGIPVMMVGAVLVLRNSRGARRRFVRFKRRYPRMAAPAMRILRNRRKRAA